MLALGLWTHPAHAVGVAGGVGVAVFDNLEDRLQEDVGDEHDVDVAMKPMVGPLVSLAMRGGDWVDHQLVVQFMSVRGPLDAVEATGPDPESISGSVGVSTIGVGYQIGLDVFGKEGRHRLSPCVAAGFIVGSAGLRVRARSDDPEVQSDLEESGLGDQRERGLAILLHALLGLRVRVSDDLGIRAVVARATTGGLSAWQPQVVADFTPRRGP
jgi:hypothetical protein